MAARAYLGRDFDFGSRRFIYRVKDAVEVDDNTWVEIERTRVYFDDVLAITFHKYRSVGFLIFTGIFGGLFGLISYAIGNTEPIVGWIFFIFCCFPFILFLALHSLLGVDVVTVYGRRTLARIKYGYRKGRAREVWEDLVRRVQENQARATAAATPPVPGRDMPPPLPPPPPAAPPTQEGPPPFRVPGQEEPPA